MHIRQIVKSWEQIVSTGMLSTTKMLNFRQKLSFLGNLIIGKAVSGFQIRGGSLFPDKVFYVIRRNNYRVGLFSMYITTAGHIKYALDNGFIPVVDMSNYKNAYLERKKQGKENSWEFFFHQPTEYSLRDAYKAKNVILSNLAPTTVRPNDSMEFFNNSDGLQDEWRIIARNYMIIRDDIKSEADEFSTKLFKGKRVLGVALRGTDYVALRPHGHPIQPPVDTVIKDAQKMLEEYRCDGIYLSTEDETIIEEFRKVFGKACIVFNRSLLSYNGGWIIDCLNNENPTGKDVSGRNYLISILLLTKTNVLLSSRASSNVGAKMITEGWEYEHYYDLGLYP